MRGIPPCGDGWFSYKQGAMTRCLHADGLGHGPTAYQAVCLLQKQMLWLCERSLQLTPLEDCFDNLHRQLKELGQGYQAAAAILDIDQQSGLISSISIGNVEVHCFSEKQAFRFPSRHGMLGGRMPSRYHISTFCPVLPALLVSWSDGIDSRAAQGYLKELVSSSSLIRLHSEAIAQRLMADFAKNEDDASCSVAILRPD